MGDLCELLVQVTTHALGRGVGVCHLRMFRLQVLQLMHEEVEVLIADGGLVQHIITVIMFVKLLAKLLDALYLVHIFLFVGCKITTFFCTNQKKW